MLTWPSRYYYLSTCYSGCIVVAPSQVLGTLGDSARSCFLPSHGVTRHSVNPLRVRAGFSLELRKLSSGVAVLRRYHDHSCRKHRLRSWHEAACMVVAAFEMRARAQGLAHCTGLSFIIVCVLCSCSNPCVCLTYQSCELPAEAQCLLALYVAAVHVERSLQGSCNSIYLRAVISFGLLQIV